MEWKLFEGDAPPHQSTFEFHEHRDRARHIDEPTHRPRLDVTLEYVIAAIEEHRIRTIVDLGCGDGGLLSLIRQHALHYTKMWGYEFSPANLVGAAERDVDVRALDFANNLDAVEWADLTVMTEVLEHLHDPHGVLRYAANRTRYIVTSSPWTEHPGSHDGCHVWAWDVDGYRDLLENAGFRILRHTRVGMFQVWLSASVKNLTDIS